jgi:hypothetical protein
MGRKWREHQVNKKNIPVFCFFLGGGKLCFSTGALPCLFVSGGKIQPLLKNWNES